MINDSFEEQQKQSHLYECVGLKSIFYGAGMSETYSDVFSNTADK